MLKKEEPKSLEFQGPKVQRLPALPRQEAHRIRRAARAMADMFALQAMQQLIDLSQNAESEVIRHACLKDLLSMSIGIKKANEEIDPDDGKVIDGEAKVVAEEALAALENDTAEAPGEDE